MGRRPKPTDRIRIPRELYLEIEAQAKQEEIDTNQLAERWLRFARDNEGKGGTVHLMGRMMPFIERLEREEKKRRKKK